MNDNRIEVSEGSTMFAGREAVNVFRAMALKSGLAMYAKCGMRPNRMWTPTAMLKAASQMTGKTFKRGQYQQAADELQKLIDNSNVPVVRS